LHGVAIVEADDTRGLSALALEWGDLLSLSISPAMTDEDLGAALAAHQAARE